MCTTRCPIQGYQVLTSVVFYLDTVFTQAIAALPCAIKQKKPILKITRLYYIALRGVTRTFFLRCLPFVIGGNSSLPSVQR